MSDARTGRILPGATIGIFGGGQLGRLTAMAARGMGYRVRVLDPDPACPARFVVDECIESGWDDAQEAANLARGSDVVTLEIEQVALSSLDTAARFAPVRPGSAVLGVIQDRIVQKNWLRDRGFPVGEFRSVHTLEELRAAIAAIGPRCFCKSATGGYDGRGQGKVGFAGEVLESEMLGAWEALGKGPGVVERAVDLDREISVLVARSPSGETRVYPAALNHHENQILEWSVIPAPLHEGMASQAAALATGLADAIRLEGILAVEMFVTLAGELLVNELAPRPHNSYHASERACITSQFEQLVRAVCNLPLGDPAAVQPAAIANLLGDLWLAPGGQPRVPHFDAALAVPGVRLHLYEKLRPRPGRKMGHLSAVGATAEEAVELVLRARALL
ncbi:MAG: 5-(carboxyamino)imidazole ribonucleotide synthase [Acidobacteriota bacterium]|nr:5-(carboxyamino)imidazole ribonucleotide synthase [Acidobacteriota bacterium]